MATRPQLIPEPFSGEGSWTQWEFHFENVAAVNGWDGAAQLKWLKVRLTGRAQIAFQKLPAETQADVERAMKALKERFEPASQKTRYQAEMQARRKKGTESWADLAEDLRLLADKAYPDLEEKAKEQLALNAYLGLLDNPQVAFGVRQRIPETLDGAVTATLELESYLPQKPGAKQAVAGVEETSTQEQEQISSVSLGTDKLLHLVERLADRVEKLEVMQNQRGSRGQWRGRGGRARRPRASQSGDPFGPDRAEIICYNCQGQGHYARECRAPPRQGNEQPPARRV